jgi:hypothetical protein
MSPPSIPDPNKAAIAGATADLSNFPFQYLINSLAQEGGSANIGGKNYDFTGQGNADVSAKMSDQMAQALLDIQKNYGSDYVAQRLKDLQQSDPTGYAARKQLFDKIMEDSRAAAPNAKMAGDLQEEVNRQLSNGGQLTGGPGGELEQVQQATRGQQIANGIILGNAPASAEASAVEGASEAKRNAAQAAAANYLNAGVSPEDVQYRQIQQSLSNLGAFTNQETPEAQFGSLAGAQNGAAPFKPVNYSTPASINPNAAAQGVQNNANLYSGQMNWASNQINPWMAGVSTATSGANLFSAAGWNPFANPAGKVGG